MDRWPDYNSDPHFQDTHVASMMHNPHPSYSITLDESNPFRRYYYCLILGMDAVVHADVCINPDSPGGSQVDLTYMMLKTSNHIGTVSRAMKRRILDEPMVFRYAHLYQPMSMIMFPVQIRLGVSVFPPSLIVILRKGGFLGVAMDSIWLPGSGFGSEAKKASSKLPILQHESGYLKNIPMPRKWPRSVCKKMNIFA